MLFGLASCDVEAQPVADDAGDTLRHAGREAGIQDRDSHVAVSLDIPARKPEARAGIATSQSPPAPKCPARSPSLARVPASRPGRRTSRAAPFLVED